MKPRREGMRNVRVNFGNTGNMGSVYAMAMKRLEGTIIEVWPIDERYDGTTVKAYAFCSYAKHRHRESHGVIGTEGLGAPPKWFWLREWIEFI